MMLTPLQRSCLHLMSRGRTLAEISRLKGRTVDEIERCLKNAFAALGADSITDSMEKASIPRGRLAGGSHFKMAKVANVVDVKVGAWIRLRRRMLAMSQTKLGAALGLTFQQIQKYEKGTNRVEASRLQNIANILQVPVTYFFEGNAGQEIGPELHQELLQDIELRVFLGTKEARDLNFAFAKISSPRVRKRFLVLVQTIGNSFQDAASDAE